MRGGHRSDLRQGVMVSEYEGVRVGYQLVATETKSFHITLHTNMGTFGILFYTKTS